MSDNPLTIALCPGCAKRVAKSANQCRHCSYEIIGRPGRFLTLGEILDGAIYEDELRDVDLTAWTRAVADLIKGRVGSIP
jgi:ribosomal protein L40E